MTGRHCRAEFSRPRQSLPRQGQRRDRRRCWCRGDRRAPRRLAIGPSRSRRLSRPRRHGRRLQEQREWGAVVKALAVDDDSGLRRAGGERVAQRADIGTGQGRRERAAALAPVPAIARRWQLERDPPSAKHRRRARSGRRTAGRVSGPADRRLSPARSSAASTPKPAAAAGAGRRRRCRADAGRHGRCPGRARRPWPRRGSGRSRRLVGVDGGADSGGVPLEARSSDGTSLRNHRIGGVPFDARDDEFNEPAVAREAWTTAWSASAICSACSGGAST